MSFNHKNCMYKFNIFNVFCFISVIYCSRLFCDFSCSKLSYYRNFDLSRIIKFIFYFLCNISCEETVCRTAFISL